MYLKIDLDSSSYIIRLPDVRNVNTGRDGPKYYIEVCYRTGSDRCTTFYFYDKDERDEVVDRIYKAFITWEYTLK